MKVNPPRKEVVMGHGQRYSNRASTGLGRETGVDDFLLGIRIEQGCFVPPKMNGSEYLWEEKEYQE